MKLEDYFDMTGIPIARFAKRCSLTYSQIRHIMLGNCPTLATALRIERYTKGEVKPEDLLSVPLYEEIFGTKEQVEVAKY